MAAPDHITLYWRQIEAGEVTVCKKTRAIYSRLVHEIEADEGRWTYDVERANRPIDWIERFCNQAVGDDAGKPLRLELWQKAFVAALFGFIDRTTGENRWTEALLIIGRKGGKSTLAAAILLYMFVACGQADLVCAATKMDQAKKIFDTAVSMVRQSPLLSKRIKKSRNMLTLERKDRTLNTFKPLGRNSHTMDGENCLGVVIDELHGLEGENGRNMYHVLRQSQSARKNALCLMVTTSGFVLNGIFTDMYELAAKIIDGTITGSAADRLLPIVYELDSPDEWRQRPDRNGLLPDGTRSAWYKANPGLEPQGGIKHLDFLLDECARAEVQPADLPTVLTKDFNARTSATGAWLQLHEIENPATFDLRDCAGKWAIGGVDLSKAGDLTCATIVMRGEGEQWLCHQCYFIPSDNLQERITNDRIPYDRWIRQGLVRTCEGGVIRTEDVTQWFLEMVQTYDVSLHSIWYDAWSATAWVDQMKGLGFRMVPVHQGAKTLSIPLDHLENALKKKQIVFNEQSTGPNSTLLWCLTNAGVQTDRNGNRVLCKNLSARHRIDGAAALLDAWVGICNSPDFQQL